MSKFKDTISNVPKKLAKEESDIRTSAKQAVEEKFDDTIQKNQEYNSPVNNKLYVLIALSILVFFLLLVIMLILI